MAEAARPRPAWLRRWPWLLLLLGGTVAVVGAPEGDDAASVPTRGPATTSGAATLTTTSTAIAAATAALPTTARADTTRPATDRLGLGRWQARTEGFAAAPTRDPFAVPRPAAPAAPTLPASAAAAPLVPTAPPFPYAFVGRWQEGDLPSAFFSRGERVFWLKPGDTVEGRWRVETLAAASMTVTHLPTQLPVQVSLGGPP